MFRVSSRDYFLSREGDKVCLSENRVRKWFLQHGGESGDRTSSVWTWTPVYSHHSAHSGPPGVPSDDNPFGAWPFICSARSCKRASVLSMSPVLILNLNDRPHDKYFCMRLVWSLRAFPCAYTVQSAEVCGTWKKSKGHSSSHFSRESNWGKLTRIRTQFLPWCFHLYPWCNIIQKVNTWIYLENSSFTYMENRVLFFHVPSWSYPVALTEHLPCARCKLGTNNTDLGEPRV